MRKQFGYACVSSPNIGDNCRLLETDTSDHVIHTVHKDFYIDAVNSISR